MTWQICILKSLQALICIACLLKTGAAAVYAPGPEAPDDGDDSKTTSSAFNVKPVPPLPPLDAPKRPYRDALLHLTLLQAEYFENEIERVEEGTHTIGKYNEMYEFFRHESMRLASEYPDERRPDDDPELSAASDRLTEARRIFQGTRFHNESEENRKKLGLDEIEDSSSGKVSFEDRALTLIQGYAAHYHQAAERVRQTDISELEDIYKTIRTDGLYLTRDLRRLSADFPEKPDIFGGTFTEEPLKSAQQELKAALEDYQSARKQKAAESAEP